MLTEKEQQELLLRLTHLETSIYRSRCRRLRRLMKEQAVLISQVRARFAQVVSECDGDYHNAAKEIRSLRKFLKNLPTSPPTPQPPAPCAGGCPPLNNSSNGSRGAVYHPPKMTFQTNSNSQPD
jgi:hypothetical protein